MLITTLTKRMAEDLTEYLDEHGVKVRYLHSDIETVERMEIIRDLRLGKFDVLVGINLLREGLDMPEVSLVAILDADKEGFLRSENSLIQTIGRAARHLNGRAILYADRDDRLDAARASTRPTAAARKQVEFNEQHGITPRGIKKGVADIMEGAHSDSPRGPLRKVAEPARRLLVADARAGHPAHQEARAGDVQARPQPGVRGGGAAARRECTSCATPGASGVPGRRSARLGTRPVGSGSSCHPAVALPLSLPPFSGRVAQR